MPKYLWKFAIFFDTHLPVFSASIDRDAIRQNFETAFTAEKTRMMDLQSGEKVP